MTCWDHHMGRVVSDTSHQRPRPQAMQTRGSRLPRALKHHHSPSQHACTSASSSSCVPPSSGKAAKLERKDFLLRETFRRALALRMDAAAPGAKGCPHGRAGETHQPSFPWRSWKQQHSFISLGTDLADKAAP